MNDSSAEGLSASFTDLMTSLAVIFILLLVAATNATVHKLQQERGKTADERDVLIKKLKAVLSDIGVKEIKADPRDPLGVIILLPSGLLNFVTNESEIPEKGLDFLQGFIPKLAGVVCQTPDMVRSPVIEGYTDDTGDDLRNVALSQNRATSVADKALKILNGQDEKDYNCFLGMMSASGRGKNDLIYVNGKLDQDMSRRVEFHLRVPSSEQRNASASVAQAAGGEAQVRVNSQHE